MSIKYQVSSIKYQGVFLILIVLLAFFLRVWQIDKNPAGFNADEAAIGYNAYSILKTGRDEYGQFLPLSFKSFGDYKPGLYFYFVVPFVAVLGLGELAVRLPSILLGVGTVFLIYFLARKIFKSDLIGLLAAFLLSISPWHIHFSRGGWETNAATFFMTLGVYLFLLSLEKSKFIIWTLIFFLAAMYLYQSPRLVVPIFIVGLALMYWRYFRSSAKAIVLAVIICGVLAIPLLYQLTSGTAASRFNGVSFLSDVGPMTRVNELRGEHSDSSSLETTLIHNKVTAYVPNLLGHYLDHFSPDFLFINGDPIIRDRVSEVGQFYIIECLFLIVGLLGLINARLRDSKILILWILIAPVASSLTYQTPNAVRSLNMVIPLTLIMAYGLFQIMNRVFKIRLGYMILGLLFIFLSFEVFHYLQAYYVDAPKRYPLAFEYGFKEMVAKLEKYQGSFDKVVITDKYDQPYILVLFYEKYDPVKYQPQAVLSNRDKFNFGTVRAFDKYEFRSINSDELKNSGNVLFVGTEDEISKNAQIIDRVNFPNGQGAFVFAKGGS